MGLDETLFVRHGKYRKRQLTTTVADVSNSQLIDILPTRDYIGVAKWIKSQPDNFRKGICYGALDMSNTYSAVYSVTLPDAVQVVDRFHLIRLCNRTLTMYVVEFKTNRWVVGEEKAILSIEPESSL